jgi:AcrR family transcriptional regulator
MPTPRARPYHHGNLRRVLLDAALEEIGDQGPTALSLRSLARRAGVSHAAPAHHFGTKAGLLTAIAVEGCEMLSEALARAREAGTFLDIGLAYVDFAVSHPAHFEVMFRPDVCDRDDPALVQARAKAAALLYGPAAEVAGPRDGQRVALAAWAFVHGFASLWSTGNLTGLGDDPVVVARSVGSMLFGRPSG